MNRQAWALKKRNKNFNVNIYRRGIVVLIASLGLSVVWALLIVLLYFSEPDRHFYASSGETAPIELKPMSAPNLSSQALLEPDPPTDNVDKMIPQ